MMVVSRSIDGGRKKLGKGEFIISGSCVQAVNLSRRVENVGRCSGVGFQHSAIIL